MVEKSCLVSWNGAIVPLRRLGSRLNHGVFERIHPQRQLRAHDSPQVQDIPSERLTGAVSPITRRCRLVRLVVHHLLPVLRSSRGLHVTATPIINISGASYGLLPHNESEDANTAGAHASTVEGNSLKLQDGLFGR